MIKLLLTVSLALGTTTWSQAASPRTTQPVQRSILSKSTSAPSDSLLYGAQEAWKHYQLVADNIPLKAPKRLKELNSSLGAYTAEELNYPAIELYGEGSWNDKVNPFFAGRQAHIPDSFAIDCKEFVYPLDTQRNVTSGYGWRRRFGRMHYGVDLQLHVGDTVRATFDGKVRFTSYERGGYGHYVVVRHPNGLETVYGHLSKQLTKEGDIVRAGDPIALGGSTGRSTGPHLHYETRFLGIPIDPAFIIDWSTGIPRDEYFVFQRHRHTKGSIAAESHKRPKGSGNGTAIATHRIKKGDTLSAISKRYGISVQKLCKLNGISKKTKLRIGQSLRVAS